MIKLSLRNLSITAAAGILAGALLYGATVTSLSSLPDGAGVFTLANHDQIDTNTTRTNTNFTNVNASLVSTIAGLPASQYCGTTATCAATVESTAIKIVTGSVALSSGTPSTAAVTGMSPAFTSTTSYTCVAQDATTVATNVGVLTAGYVSGSAVTFTGPNTNTDTIRYTCIGF